ncbi:hypothetical protein DXX93_02340 [Thalassotalea euphylliae]|uniref:Uncharacterized protein n=1 Tax=Thalassotalea euphylliae TaxID=1655234 RepID=A0A3E0TLQ9_9GAMM|nr:hypothetical protein [Thalassotalea euphylliae]REL25499.1 hypothetical protein DXX93_02340 [Thalassotalea euphylliae]
MNKFTNILVGSVMSMSIVAATAQTAHAAETSTEQVITQFVVAQGKQVVANLGEQLQQSIADNIAQFSVEQTFSWSSAEIQVATTADGNDSDNENEPKAESSEEE